MFTGISITDIVLPVASQSMVISAIVPDLSGCTVAKFRAEVTAPQPGFVFLWALDNGTASVRSFLCTGTGSYFSFCMMNDDHISY